MKRQNRDRLEIKIKPSDFIGNRKITVLYIPLIRLSIASGMGYRLPINQVPNNKIIRRESGLITASFTASSTVFILSTVQITRPSPRMAGMLATSGVRCGRAAMEAGKRPEVQRALCENAARKDSHSHECAYVAPHPFIFAKALGRKRPSLRMSLPSKRISPPP